MNTQTPPTRKPDAEPAAKPAAQHQASNCEESDTPSVRSVAGLLAIASLFALVGGSLDAYTYLTHDHVFSTAESGNVILFGVFASGGDWARALLYLPPIGAFVLGTAVARLLGVQTKKHTFRATLICQVLEGALLLVLAVVGAKLSSRWVVPAIAFCAALQSVSFNALGPWKFNDAMTTSNLRQATSAVIFTLMGKDRKKNAGQAIVSATVFACFLSGALLGGLYTRWDPRHALGPSVVLVLLGLLLTWRQRLLYHQHTSPAKSDSRSAE